MIDYRNKINEYEAKQHIRQFNEKVIIIAQTAYAVFGDREKALETGCNEYLAKPILESELFDKINTLLPV